LDEIGDILEDDEEIYTNSYVKKQDNFDNNFSNNKFKIKKFNTINTNTN